jgi:hypothetical protein
MGRRKGRRRSHRVAVPREPRIRRRLVVRLAWVAYAADRHGLWDVHGRGREDEVHHAEGVASRCELARHRRGRPLTMFWQRHAFGGVRGAPWRRHRSCAGCHRAAGRLRRQNCEGPTRRCHVASSSCCGPAARAARYHRARALHRGRPRGRRRLLRCRRQKRRRGPPRRSWHRHRPAGRGPLQASPSPRDNQRRRRRLVLAVATQGPMPPHERRNRPRHEPCPFQWATCGLRGGTRGATPPRGV